MNTGNGPLAAKRALEEFGFVLPPRTVMYITDSAAYTGLGSGTRRQGWAVEWLLQQDRIPADEAEPCHQKCAGTAVCEVDPLDLVETIREGVLVLDPDRTVRFAHRSFGEFTSKDTPRDKEGWR